MNPSLPLEPRPWPARRWWTVVILVILAHIALVVIFGARQTPPLRPASRVPLIQLAANKSPLVTLDDPTLFALPHPNDFAAVNWPPLITNQPAFFRWREAPNWLPLSHKWLNQTFNHFMITNQNQDWAIDFKPAPQFNAPKPPEIPVFSQPSSLRLRGDLAGRTLLNPRTLPHWPASEVIAPSKVQVVVDPSGRVLSAVLLPADYGLELAARNEAADQFALQTARSAKFSPASQLMVGQMIFNWLAVPPPAEITNQPPGHP